MILVCGALLSNLIGRVLLHPFWCCGIRFLCRPSNSFALNLLSIPQKHIIHLMTKIYHFSTLQIFQNSLEISVTLICMLSVSAT